jgi:hypothetical protein
MLLTKYKIVAMPFPQSDATAEFFEYATDENDALDRFTKRYPSFRVKSVEESA